MEGGMEEGNGEGMERGWKRGWKRGCKEVEGGEMNMGWGWDGMKIIRMKGE